MKSFERLLLPVLVAIPVLVLGLFPIAPRPVQLTIAWQQAVMAQAVESQQVAAEYYRQVIYYQPQRVDLWDRIGSLEFSAGNYNAAILAYNQASESGTISSAGLLNLGDSNTQAGDTASAAAAWVAMAELSEGEPQHLSTAAQRLRDAGDLAKTLVVAQRWQELDPQSVPAAWLTGLLISPQSRTESARLLAIAGNGEGNDAEKARSLLEVLGQAALQTDPAYQQILIGQRLAELGEWDVAEAAFTSAVNLAPNYAEAWAFLGETRQHLGKDGRNDLMQAKNLAPESDFVLSALALYWNRQNKPEVALRYLQTLARNHPSEGAWQIEIGSTLAQSGDLVAAMSAYQRATEIEPENAQLWRTLALFSATYGFDFTSYSEPALERALALSPRDLLVLDAAGWIYLTNGELEKAEQFLQQALAEDGDFEAAQLHLAQVYLAGNHFSLASPLLKAAAAQSNDPVVALQAQRLLDKHFPAQ
ncbi:MAG TPA: tetratricopeptide repeat protein [Bellilinea sp.]|nr:tetratricopeptide repeat protein [Bellilinea sp.]